MIIFGASLYLPQHIMTIASRAWFYYAGEEALVTNSNDQQLLQQPGEL